MMTNYNKRLILGGKKGNYREFSHPNEPTYQSKCNVKVLFDGFLCQEDCIIIGIITLESVLAVNQALIPQAWSETTKTSSSVMAP